jgi:hypothetical protein
MSVLATWSMGPAARSRVLTFGILCSLHVVPSSPIGAQPAAGYVVDISGSWIATTNGKEKTLQIGSDLFVGGRVVPGGRSDSVRQFIQILLPSRASMASDCSDTTRFTRTAACEVLLVRKMPEEGVLQRALAMATGHLRHQPERYESLISRGVAVTLADGVVRGRGELVDIAPLLASAPAGRYRLCFVAVDPEDTLASGGDGSCRATVAYEFSPQRAIAVKLPEPLRGLFELRVARASQRSSLWVLIEEGKDYSSMQRAYTRFSASLTSVRPTLSPEAVQRLRRAYLAALSSGGAAPVSASRSR